MAELNLQTSYLIGLTRASYAVVKLLYETLRNFMQYVVEIFSIYV